MILYLIQVTLCLAIFYAFYHFALKRETMFHTNRLYLLTTLVISLVLPLIKIYIDTLTDASDMIVAPATYVGSYLYSISDTIIIRPEQKSFPWGKLIMAVYFTGVVIMAFRLLLAIREILRIRSNGTHTMVSGKGCILSDDVKTPFSFFNTVYLPRHHGFQETELREVFAHEMAHIEEKHTWDILLMELVCIALWPSPIVYLYRKSLKDVHEYVADAAVIKETPWENYAQLLVSQQSNHLQNILSHQLIYSQLKKRLLMMNKERSGGWARYKYIGIIPILILAMVVFSFREKENTTRHDVNSTLMISRNDTASLYMSASNRYFLNSIEIPFDQLQSALSETMQDVADPVLKVLVDKTVTAGEMVKIDDLASKLKIRVFFQKNEKFDLYKSGLKVNWTPSGDTLPETYVTALRTLEPLEGNLNSLSPLDAELDMKQYGYERELPIFPGCENVPFADQGICGMTKLGEYINTNMKYPESVRKSGIGGRVVVKFVVGADGYVKDVAIADSLHPDADKVVLELIQDMNVKVGKWMPARKAGKSVDAEMHLPIQFALDNTAPKSEPIKTVDEMARFPGCEHIDNPEERSNCAQSKMFEFIYSNLNYPKEDRNNNVEGMGIIQFVIGIDGSLSDINVVRSPSETINAELMRVANLMASLPDKWIPAYKEGKPVAFQLTMPVKFKLQEDASKSKDVAKKELDMVALTVTPNPASNTISIIITEGAHALKIFDTSGKPVISQSIPAGTTGKFTIDVSSIPSGQYVVQVQGAGQPVSGTFTILR
jgi:bla regulator protein blaR1